MTDDNLEKIIDIVSKPLGKLECFFYYIYFQNTYRLSDKLIEKISWHMTHVADKHRIHDFCSDKQNADLFSYSYMHIAHLLTCTVV